MYCNHKSVKLQKVAVNFTYVAGNQCAKLAMVALYLRQIHYNEALKHTHTVSENTINYLLLQ